MDANDTLARIRELGLLAVLRGPTPELTLQMVEALVAGGVRGIEITFSTPDATGVVERLAQRYGDEILLGMGTLTAPAQAAAARAAGARFLVSPHCEQRLARAMLATRLLVMVGALTPSEIVHAYSLGAHVVKLFPGSLGGPGYLKGLRGPFPDIPIVPTGGVSADNAGQWFAAGALAVAAGSELCPANLAREGRFEEITQRALTFQAAVEAARPRQA